MRPGTTVLIVKCLGCSPPRRREIRAGSPEAQTQPMCDGCYLPMIADRAVTSTEGGDDGD